MFLLGLATIVGEAQHTTSDAGYFPCSYQGDIFTGRVNSINVDTQEFTLTYSKGSKTETFVGRLEALCDVNTGGKKVKSGVDGFPEDAVLQVLYFADSHKENGKQVKQNIVFWIMFVEAEGKVLVEDKRPHYQCSNQK